MKTNLQRGRVDTAGGVGVSETDSHHDPVAALLETHGVADEERLAILVELERLLDPDECHVVALSHFSVVLSQVSI